MVLDMAQNVFSPQRTRPPDRAIVTGGAPGPARRGFAGHAPAGRTLSTT